MGKYVKWQEKREQRQDESRFSKWLSIRRQHHLGRPLGGRALAYYRGPFPKPRPLGGDIYSYFMYWLPGGCGWNFFLVVLPHSYVTGRIIVLESIVTAPIRANALPSSVAPVFNEMD
jgi:hypothetical protein